jgi:pimeloyl-ACP methyl ester carboxylesterase
MPYDQVPSNASLKVEPFKAHVPDLSLEGFKLLLRVSPIGVKTYENQVADVHDYTGFGVSREWLENSKEHWIEKYDWRKTEAKINSYNNYTVEIEDNGFKFTTHFLGLFSKKKDAVPLLLIHGWPGSFLEHLDVVNELKSKYDEDSLPYHIIAPSLPGSAYSNGPPLDKNFTTEDAARIMDKLMVGIGFGDGYVTQGGDIGSFVSRILGVTSDACKAVHRMLAAVHGKHF